MWQLECNITNKRLLQILKDIIIIIDSREKENFYIIDWFDSKGIKYIERKLEYGDYSFYCPPIPEIGFDEQTSFEKIIIIERKADLSELSGNLSQQRDRFERELERSLSDKAKFILMVENGSWDKIIEHRYRTDFNEKSYLASLFSFSHRYNIQVQFVPAKYAGMFIYSQFYYMLREQLREMIT